MTFFLFLVTSEFQYPLSRIAARAGITSNLYRRFFKIMSHLESFLNPRKYVGEALEKRPRDLNVRALWILPYRLPSLERVF